MITIVLRVRADRLDLERCRAWMPIARVAQIWRPGDRTLGGTVSADFGFNLFMAEGTDSASVVEEGFVAFQSIASYVADLVQQGARAALDIGLMIGPEAGSLSVRVLATFMRTLEQSGVDVVVSAYPSSD